LSEDEDKKHTLNFTQDQDTADSDEASTATSKQSTGKSTTKLEEVKPTAPSKMADNTNTKAGLPLNSGECGD
jgi:hypothetical protein